MTRRILTIIVAVVLAVIGTGAVMLYVKQADQRALAGQKAVSVLVATQQVPAGTSAGAALRDGYVQAQKLPSESVPADALRSIGPAISGLVLSANLPSGQLLLRPMLVTRTVAATGLAIPTGEVALSVLMCLQKAVAGYIHPGSQIAVFNTFFTMLKGKLGNATVSCTGDNWPTGVKAVHTRLVLTNVSVLAVGSASNGSTSTTTTSTGVFSSSNSSSSSSSNNTTLMVTVAVSQKDAERLIHLAEAGIPYLALVTASSGTKTDINLNP